MLNHCQKLRFTAPHWCGFLEDPYTGSGSAICSRHSLKVRQLTSRQ